jgi:hypothetical protein
VHLDVAPLDGLGHQPVEDDFGSSESGILSVLKFAEPEDLHGDYSDEEHDGGSGERSTHLCVPFLQHLLVSLN